MEITPLGAAIVEVLPDQKRKRELMRRFKRLRECPVSKVFGPKAVVRFYRERGEQVTAVWPSDCRAGLSS